MRAGELQLSILLRSDFRLYALLILTLGIYLPSTAGGFLGYDDSWMIEHNSFFADPSWTALESIWFDVSKPTRLLLGAEYLPVRDSTVLLDVMLFGHSPQGMRLVNLAWYLLASYLCVLCWRRALGTSLTSDFLAAFFVLHPAHAESVAWIVGRKDVLGLTLFWAGVHAHLSTRSRLSWSSALLLASAQLSKFLFVASPLLLFGLDILRRQRITVRYALARYLLPCAVCLGLAALQLFIAQETTMVSAEAPPWTTRLLVMGPVWWNYLETAFLGIGLNVMHEVTPPSQANVAQLVGYVPVLAWGLGALAYAVLTKKGLPLAGAVWFFAPLSLVSQIVAIQNYHADRYLLLSVMAPGLVYANIWSSRVRGRPFSQRWYVRALPWALLLHFTTASGYRAYLFADPVKLFTHATDATSQSALAPYQLGLTHEALGQDERALVAYHLALGRSPRDEGARMATNNLARIYVRHGNLPRAEHYLRRGLALWPGEAKILGNLAEVVWLSGREAEARALYEELIFRFPSYEFGKAKYREHFVKP